MSESNRDHIDLLQILDTVSQIATECQDMHDRLDHLETSLTNLSVTKLTKRPPFVEERAMGFELTRQSGLTGAAVRMNGLRAITKMLIADIFAYADMVDDAVAGRAALKASNEARPETQRLYSFLSATRPDLAELVPVDIARKAYDPDNTPPVPAIDEGKH